MPATVGGVGATADPHLAEKEWEEQRRKEEKNEGGEHEWHSTVTVPSPRPLLHDTSWATFTAGCPNIPSPRSLLWDCGRLMRNVVD